MKIHHLLVLVTFFPFYAMTESGIPAFAKKYPDGLLTNDYGILNEDDLAINAWSQKPVPYKSEKSGAYVRWQCFPVKNVKPKFRTWKDSLHPNQKITLCSLDIWVKKKNETHVYIERRAYEANHCYDFMNSWKKLTHNENHVCLSGEDKGPDKNPNPGEPTASEVWVWHKIKTKKGCMEYFGGFLGKKCDLEYWKSQGYPNATPPQRR